MENADEILILWLMLASGVVWTQALRGLWAGRPLLPRYEREHAAWSPAALSLATAWIGLQAWGEIRTFGEPTPDVTLRGVVAQLVLFVVVFAALLGLVLQADRPAAFGLRRDGWRRQAGEGALGFLASWLPVVLVLDATESLRSLEQQHSFLKLLRDDQGWQTMLWIAVSAVVVAPLVEELLFRVVLQGGLARWLPRWAALGTAAVVFSAVHGWPDMLPLLPLALVLGYVYDQRHSYLAAVVAHGLFNLTMLIAQLLMRDAPPAPV